MSARTTAAVGMIICLIIVGLGTIRHISHAAAARNGERSGSGNTESTSMSRRSVGMDTLGAEEQGRYTRGSSPATVSIDPADLTVAPGSKFTVTVLATDVEDLGGFEFEIGYTPSVVQVQNIALGLFPGSTGRTWAAVGPTIDNGTGVARFGAFSFGSQAGATGTGALAIISLSAQPGAEGDDTQLDLRDVQVLDTEGTGQTVTVQDGHVTVGESNTAPTISGLPDQALSINGSADNVMDLWAYADDAENADAELTFTISNAPAPEAGVTIDSNRYIDINPDTGWTGETEVEIQVEDTGGLTASDSFQVVVNAETVYLPVVTRRWPPIPDTPVLNPINNPDGDGNYTVGWNGAYLADAYVLQEDDNAAFSSPTTRYTGSGTSWNATSKAPGTYYYQVKASNAWGDSSWSNAKSVTVVPPTNPPYQPSNPTPADGAANQGLNVDLSWTGGDPDSSDTVTYDVYFEEGNSTPEELRCNDVSATSCDPGTLERAGHYYWYVEARDNHGATTSSETWDFYTQCPKFKTGQWGGAADFRVSGNRSRVLDFSLDIYCPNCFDGELTATELPIENCRIEFAAEGSGAQVWGGGTFVSDTDMEGSFSVLTSHCMCWGTWFSWWVSSSQQSNASTDSPPAKGAAMQSIVVRGEWPGFIAE